MGDSRTILTEYIAKGQDSPLYGGSYSVIANRLPGSGGTETDRISAKVLDDHFLIINWKTVPDLEKILGVVNIDKLQEAEERMYQEAKKIAEERAIFNENIVIDVTSRTTSLPPNAGCYVVRMGSIRSFGGCGSFNDLKEKLKKKPSA